MWPRDAVLSTLRERDELWEVAPGLVGFRGAAGRLFRALEAAIADVCDEETDDEWRVPPALPLATLARAEYFASFPQWLTLAAHLDGSDDVLRHVAESPAPDEAARRAAVPSTTALTPAACYHVYSALTQRTIHTPRIVTTQATCWRREAPGHTPLERDWGFTMREVACIGSEDHVRLFVDRLAHRVASFAASLGLDFAIELAADPFFAPTARGKALLQRAKSLKRELLLPVDRNHSIAASSFNLHERFFGDAFDIRVTDGTPAFSGCVAFGIERWTLAFLVRHGPDPDRWPFISGITDRGALKQQLTGAIRDV